MITTVRPAGGLGLAAATGTAAAAGRVFGGATPQRHEVSDVVNGCRPAGKAGTPS